MPELREIVPKPALVAKERRCAAGPCVKTMLCGNSATYVLKCGESKDSTNSPDSVAELMAIGQGTGTPIYM